MSSWRTQDKGTFGRTGLIIGASVVSVVILGFVAYCLVKKNEAKRRKSYTPTTLPRYMLQPNLTVPPSAHVRPCRPSTPEQLPAYRPPQPGTNIFSNRDDNTGSVYSAATATRIIRTSDMFTSSSPSSTLSAQSDTSNGSRRHIIPRRPVPSSHDITDLSPSYVAAITPFTSRTDQRLSGGTSSREARMETGIVGLKGVRQSKSIVQDEEERPPNYEQVSGGST